MADGWSYDCEEAPIVATNGDETVLVAVISAYEELLLERAFLRDLLKKDEALLAEIEKLHGGRFGKLAKLLKEGTYFEKQEENGLWMCLNCGHIHTGKKVPGTCPVCRYERGYYIPVKELLI